MFYRPIWNLELSCASLLISITEQNERWHETCDKRKFNRINILERPQYEASNAHQFSFKYDLSILIYSESTGILVY